MENNHLNSPDQPSSLSNNASPHPSKRSLSRHQSTRNDPSPLLISTTLTPHSPSPANMDSTHLHRLLNDPSRLTDSASFVSSRFSDTLEPPAKPAFVPRKHHHRYVPTGNTSSENDHPTNLDLSLTAQDDHVNQLYNTLPLYRSSASRALFREDYIPDRPSPCVVCFSVSDDDMRTCPLCFINTCHDCFSNWLEIRIQGGHSTELTCLKCISPISPDEVLAFCSERLYKKHMYYLSKEQHRENPYAVWCPKDGCWALLQDSKRDTPPLKNEMRCPDCNSLLCTKCLSFYHDDEKCPTPQFVPCQRALVHFWQRIHTKKCPRCLVRIQRAGGCSQMRCTSCQTKFCWRCRGLLHAAMFNQLGEPQLRLCICPRTTQTVVIVSIAGGVLLTFPLVLAVAVVVGPPALIGYVTLPPEKKARIRMKISTLVNRL